MMRAIVGILAAALIVQTARLWRERRQKGLLRGIIAKIGEECAWKKGTVSYATMQVALDLVRLCGG